MNQYRPFRINWHKEELIILKFLKIEDNIFHLWMMKTKKMLKWRGVQLVQRLKPQRIGVNTSLQIFSTMMKMQRWQEDSISLLKKPVEIKEHKSREELTTLKFLRAEVNTSHLKIKMNKMLS